MKKRGTAPAVVMALVTGVVVLARLLAAANSGTATVLTTKPRTAVGVHFKIETRNLERAEASCECVRIDRVDATTVEGWVLCDEVPRFVEPGVVLHRQNGGRQFVAIPCR